MTDPSRALITKLLAALRSWSPSGGGPLEGAEEQYEADLIARVEAFLRTTPAQIEPEGVIDDELLRTYGIAKRDYCYEGPSDDWPKRAERAATIHGLRAVLARYARPTIQPEPQAPTDEELTLVYAYAVAAAVGNKRGPFKREDAEAAQLAGLRAVLTRYARPTIQPVPVSERPWEREGWCDEYGMCWRFDPCDRGWWSYGPILPSDGDPAPFTHLLPHHALPTP